MLFRCLGGAAQDRQASRVGGSGRWRPWVSAALVVVLLSPSWVFAPAGAVARTAAATSARNGTAAEGGLVASRSWGWTEGQFSVGADGAAEYRLPLWTPKGRANLHPELSLSYNSRGGNGLLGVGWSLTGVISKITPCPRSVGQDGVLDGVRFDGTDVYCLDGNRLRPTGPSTGTQRVYRTERDSFSRVIGYGAAGAVPSYFRVWTKDGKILTFGQQSEENTGQQRAYRLKAGPSVSAPSLVRASDVRVTAAWVLHRIEDRTGNTMSIEWRGSEGGAADLWYSQLWPHAIHYAPNRSIRLRYEDRADPIDSFERGIHVRTTTRLSRIEMYAGPTGGQSELLREYRLNYRNDSTTGRSLLGSVSECDPDDVCLEPLEFRWSLGSYEFDAIHANVTDAGISENSGGRVDAGDVNGDGKDDLLYPSTDNRWMRRYSVGNGFFEGPHQMVPGIEPTVRQDARPIDFDRDGRLDLMAQVVDPTCECAEISEYYLYEADNGPYDRYEPDVDGGHISFYAPQRRDSAYFVDLDGNGLPDYATPRAEATLARWRYRLNTGAAGAGRFEPMVHTNHPLGHIFGPTNEEAFVRVLDSDGDGRAELLQLQNGVSPARFETFGLDAAGQVAPKRESINLPVLDPFGIKTQLADVNGDGLPDAVYPFDGLKVQLNSGNGFGPFISGPAEYLAPEGPFLPNSVDYSAGVRSVDFNNDGHEDILVFHDGMPSGSADYRRGIQLYVWRDGHFDRVPLNREAVELVRFGFSATGVFDVDGNGALDIYHLADGDPDFIQVLRRTGGTPDLLLGVGIGTVGQRVEVEYTTLANRGVHQPGQCGYPLVCAVRGGSIVMRHLVANGASGATGNDGWNTFHHRYKAARVDQTGRGWLGFAEHTVIDDRAGTTTVTEFDNTTRMPGAPDVYPYAHLPGRITQTVDVDADTVYRRTVTNTFALRRLAVPGTYTVEQRTSLDLEQEQAPGATNWSTLRVRTNQIEYDTFGNQLRSTSAAGLARSVTNRMTYRNDEAAWLIGRPVSQVSTGCVDLEGSDCVTRRSTLDYDVNGNLSTTVTEPDDPALLRREVLTRDGYGNVTSVRTSGSTGESRTDTYSYDDGLHATAITNALAQTTRLTVHSGLGAALSTTDPNGATTTMRYDRFGRLRETNYPDGGFEHVDHILFGAHFVQVTDAGGGTVLTQLDTLGREVTRNVRTFSGGWAANQTRFDQLGRVAGVSRPALSGQTPLFTSYAYDGLGRTTRQTEPDGVFVRHDYPGLETHTHDGRGIHSYTVETIEGLLESRYEDDPASAGWLRTRFEYGPFGELTRSTAPDNTAQTMTYDVLGRRLRHTGPSTGSTVSTYNPFGELVSETDGAGAVTRFEYDALGRVRRTLSPDGTATNTWDTAANGIGRLGNARSADGVVTRYTYDEFGRTASRAWNIDGFQYEIGLDYDAVGRLSRTTYPRIPGVSDRLAVSYGYNEFGYLDRVGDPAGGTPYWQAEERDAAGQLVRERLGNGVLGTRAYQPATGLPQSITTTGPGGQLGQITYGYDGNRNVTGRTDVVNQRTERYEYDELNRLERWHTLATGPGQVVVNATYAYDRVGNLTAETFQPQGQAVRTTTYGYGERDAPPHALTSRNSTRYSYDGAGRQLGGPQRTVEYNRTGLPAAINWGIGQGAGQRTEFDYDADGARVHKRDEGNQSIVSVPGLFERRSPAGTGSAEIHNMHHIVVEGRTVAQVNRVQSNTGGPVLQTQVWYLHADQQGSTNLVTGPSGRPAGEDGSWLAELFYDPFGRRVDARYEPLGDNRRGGPRIGYAGHEHDDEYGLINMKGRIYDPEARRFLTPDPVISEPLSGQSHNRYSYVGNNPATATDPSGLSPDWWMSHRDLFPMPTVAPEIDARSWIDWADAMAAFEDLATQGGPAPSSADDNDGGYAMAAGEVIVVTGKPIENHNGNYFWREGGTYWGLMAFESLPRQFASRESWENSIYWSKEIEGKTDEQLRAAFGGTAALNSVLEKIVLGVSILSPSVGLATDLVDVLDGNGDPLAILSALAPGPGGTGVARMLGKAGEAGVPGVRNVERVASLSGTARYRVPDRLNHATKEIGEVKNVLYQHLSWQLRDDIAYAGASGYTFYLWVRPRTGMSLGTVLSRAVQECVDAGLIKLMYIGK